MEQKQVSRKTEFLSLGALLVVTILWGGGFIFSTMALEAGLSPAAVMFGRFTLASLITGLLFFKQIKREYKPGQWKGGLVIGLILFAAFYMQIIALQYTTPANNAFITGIYVVLVPLMWWVLTKKRPPSIMFVACILSFAGAAILAIAPGQGFNISLGDSLTLLCAFLFAAQIVATSKLAQTIHPTVLVFMQFTVSAVLSFVFYMITDRNFSAFLVPKAMVSIGYLGAFSTCLCYFLQTIAQRYVTSAQAGVVMAMEALFGALFSVLLGYDQLTVRMIVGGLLMFASVLLPELWAGRMEKKRAMGAATEAPEEAPPDVESE